MAAGVTLRKDALAAFRAFLEETLATTVDGGAARGRAADRRRAHGGRRDRRNGRRASRGPGRSAPAIRSRSSRCPTHTLVYAEEVGQAHVRARLRAGDGAVVNAIAFRAAGQKLGEALTQNRGQPVHAAGTLSIDRWNGEERVQLRLLDIAPADAGLRLHSPL